MAMPPKKPVATSKRPRNWRHATGAPVGRPPRIFDTIPVQRVDRTATPHREYVEQMRLPDRICELLRGGVPASGAAESVGITATTHHNWRAMGTVDQRAGKHSVYVEYLEASTRAIGESMVGLVAEMRGHGRRGDSRATEFMLRNRFPKEFGDRHRVELVPPEEEITDEVAERSIREAASHLDDSIIDVPGVSAEERRALVADTKKKSRRK